MKAESPPDIAAVYPDFTPEQREEAEANLRKYLAVLLRMAERLEREGRSINDLAVDCSFDENDDPRYHPIAKGRLTNQPLP
jgi:hypothetical protein